MNECDEIFDVVDSENKIIGQASRYEVHRNALMHRSAHILVFNHKGNLFLQKRSMNKDESPGLWDSSAAGHVASGEDYLFCAKRELEEELSVSNEPLDQIMYIPAQPKTLWEHVHVYRCVTGSKIKINEYEVSEGRFWGISEVKVSIISNPNIFTSTFHHIFDNYIFARQICEISNVKIFCQNLLSVHS